MEVMLKNVRLAFPDLWEARAIGDSEPRFAATFIFAPGSVAEKLLRSAIAQAAKDKWAAKAEVNLTMAKAKNRICLHDGAEKAKFDGFAGNLYVTASNKQRPLVIDKDKSPLLPEDGRPYAGCTVNALIDVWAQDNSYGVGINASLMGVQFVSDGERFGGGGVATADQFDAVEEEGDLA